MTASVDSLLALITAEHRDQPKFSAFVAAVTEGLVDITNVIETLPARFDVDVAIGQQLDFVGEWVNLSRNLREPIDDVYFSFGDPDLGFGSGFLKGRFSPTDGVIQLDDATFRLMIYAKIAANVWDGTLLEAERILATIFSSSPGTHIFLQDNMDMSIDVAISGVVPSKLFQALIGSGYFEVRGAGVEIDNVFINEGPFFGFGVQNYNIAGFGSGKIQSGA